MEYDTLVDEILLGVAVAAVLVGLSRWRRWRAVGVVGMLAAVGVAWFRTTVQLPLLVPVALIPVGIAVQAPRWRSAWAAATVLALAAWWGIRDRVVYETYACNTPNLPLARSSTQTSPPAWRLPASVTHLVDLQGRIEGPAPGGDEHLALWAGEELASWKVAATEDGRRFRLPLLQHPLRHPTRMSITLTPAGGSAVRVFLTPKDRYGTLRRRTNDLVVPLDGNADPDAPVTLSLDVAEMISGNWESAEGRVYGVEITVEGTRKAVLHEVILDGPDALYRDAAAGVRIAELQGTLRPSWFVNGGASVEVQLTVPEGQSALRWHDGAIGQTGTRTMVLVDEEGLEHRLMEHTSGGRWRRAASRLDEWAGQQVRLRMSTEGGGTGLFGDPRVVSVADRSATPDVLVYLVDTLRADHLGAWGAPEPTPAFDRLASEGLSFGLAISSSCWTKPAIPTLMSGIWPTTHQVGAQTVADRLPDSVPTLQDRFRAAGWRTASVSASPHGSTLAGLERGFSTVVPPRHWGISRSEFDTPTGGQLHQALLDWWDEEPDQPSMAYVHTLEVHQYYVRDGESLRTPERYDASVHDADKLLGQLLDTLHATGRDENLLVVVLSDHGESFMDHAAHSHGTSLFQSQVHVPLIFWAPGAIQPATINDPVGLADVAPTLLDLFGLPPLAEADGESLVPYLSGRSEPIHDSVPSALLRFTHRPDAPQQFAVVDSDLSKLLRIQGDGDYGFDLSADLCERTTGPVDEEGLQATLDAWLAEQERAHEQFVTEHGPDSPGAATGADMQMLKTLGYVE